MALDSVSKCFVDPQGRLSTIKNVPNSDLSSTPRIPLPRWSVRLGASSHVTVGTVHTRGPRSHPSPLLLPRTHFTWGDYSSAHVLLGALPLRQQLRCTPLVYPTICDVCNNDSSSIALRWWQGCFHADRDRQWHGVGVAQARKSCRAVSQ